MDLIYERKKGITTHLRQRTKTNCSSPGGALSIRDKTCGIIAELRALAKRALPEHHS